MLIVFKKYNKSINFAPMTPDAAKLHWLLKRYAFSYVDHIRTKK